MLDDTNSKKDKISPYYKDGYVRWDSKFKRQINERIVYNKIVKYYEKPIGSKIPEDLAEDLMCIAYINLKFNSRYNFTERNLLEDIIGDSIEIMLIGLLKRKFDINKSKKPIAYFSRFVVKSLSKSLVSEGRQQYIKDPDSEMGKKFIEYRHKENERIKKYR